MARSACGPCVACTTGMSARHERASSHFRIPVAFVCLIALAAPLAVAQTADPGGSGTPAPPSTQPSYSPLTGDERLHRYVQSMVGPMSWVTGAFSAGFGQLRNRPEEWGQGARGFGLRMGSGFATRVTRETIGYGVAGLLHEDNRFFRSEETTTDRKSTRLNSSHGSISHAL